MRRILIADDQPDVLKALRLLFKPEGCLITEVTTPEGILAELEAREFDVLLMDLNYTRDTTSGLEGLGASRPHPGGRQHAFDCRDDRLRQRRSGG